MISLIVLLCDGSFDIMP